MWVDGVEVYANFWSTLLIPMAFMSGPVLQLQPRELGKKYDGNFIFTFAVVKVRYGSIATAKIFKHGNYLK